MIKLQGVHKSYHIKGVAMPALAGVDLSVRPGEVFGIMGQSGAGKSSLLRIINLLERPTRGLVLVGGVDLLTLGDQALRQFRQGVGMIFQHFNLLGSKTVGENVAFPIQVAGKLDKAAMDQRVDELLQLVGLQAHKDKYPRQLSGGEKQRVGIARALANHPSVLLCDEATSALDPQTTRSTLQLLRQINETLQLTIVLITHEMDVIRTLCDRVAVLDAGQIVEEGPVTRVFLHPTHPTTQRFVQETENLLVQDTRLAGFERVKKTVHRLTFLQDTVHRPLLSQTARAQGVDFSILSGRVGPIKSAVCGQLTVLFEGEPARVQAALAGLAAEGVAVEEVLA